MLTCGVQLISGSVVAVLLLGVIQSLITFDGTLSSWRARIAIGALLCVFCLMQRVLGRSQRSASVPPSGGHHSARPAAESANDAAAPAAIGHAQHATVSLG